MCGSKFLKKGSVFKCGCVGGQESEGPSELELRDLEKWVGEKVGRV